MIRYLKTSIFDSPAKTLVNPVNCVGVMGAGLAVEFKRRYPDMFHDYRHLCETGEIQPGYLHIYQESPKWVLNFPTKLHWKDPSRIEYIQSGLWSFVKHHRALGIVSVAFPKLGCGLGGLRWGEVDEVLNFYLGAIEIPVYIHL